MTEKQRYPLAWPSGWRRTSPGKRKVSRYEVSQERAQKALMHSLFQLEAKHVALSTNIKLRKDGLPFASQRTPDDPGVALYFVRKGKDVCIACDKFKTIRCNIRAIGLTLEAIRSIERAGSTDLLDRAFQGYAALPASFDMPPPEDWREVLGLEGVDDAIDDAILLVLAREQFQLFAQSMHPDKTGGDRKEWDRIERAWQAAQKELS